MQEPASKTTPSLRRYTIPLGVVPKKAVGGHHTNDGPLTAFACKLAKFEASRIITHAELAETVFHVRREQ